jgi:heme-degrading monooxygenase HmoA
MHARVSRYRGDVGELRAGFEAIHDELEELEGFVQAYFLVDEDHGRAMSMTMWERAEDMWASDQRAHEMRTGATHPVDATIESVEHFEIAATAKPGGVMS